MPARPLARRGGRSAAAVILERVEAGRGHSNALLAALPARMDERERALATELVYGVLRRRRALDAAIEGASSRSLGSIAPAVLTVLRLAVYQILFLTRVPRAAAVNEAVKGVRTRSGRAAAAFANAVLRGVCRALTRSPQPVPALPDPARDHQAFVSYLETAHSFPRFLVERFLGRYGPSGCEALLDTLNRPAPVVLRPTRRGGSPEVVIRRLAEEGIVAVPSPVLAGALRVVRGAAQRSALFREGAFYIQDEASQMVARLLLPIGAGEGLLDLCAAPGGKILVAAEGCPPDAGPIIAADRSLARLRVLGQNARRLGVQGLIEVAMDATRPALAGRFSRVLLDPPCSGTGIIRRHPEIRWRRVEEEIGRFALRQSQALEQACDLVAPGGRLVYAVCSLEPEEGSERIAAILAARPEMKPFDARSLLPFEAQRFVDPSGYLSTLPHRDDQDGFFAAVLVRDR